MPNIRLPLLAELKNQLSAAQLKVAQLEALVHTSPTLAIPREQIDPVYYRDDYPREGCTLVIDVEKDAYYLAVFEPGGNRIEAYGAARSAKAIGGMVELWCEGSPPNLDGTVRAPIPPAAQEAP